MTSTESSSIPDANLVPGSSVPPYPLFIIRRPASTRPSVAVDGLLEGTSNVRINSNTKIEVTGFDQILDSMSTPYSKTAKVEIPELKDSQIKQAAVKMEDSVSSSVAKVEEDAHSEDSDDGVVVVKHKQTESSSNNCCTKLAAPKIISRIKVAKYIEKQKPSPQPKPRKEKPPKKTSPLIPGDSRIFSTRVGEHFMDGPSILANFSKAYMRPWDDCIPIEELSLDNMPPFFRRLRNDQVGHLVEWINDRTRVSITPANANLYWPYDMTGHGGAASKRDRWGKAYTGRPVKHPFSGGPALPTYINMGLPLTWTSSGKAMCPDTGAPGGETGNKRKADQMDESVDSNGKRFCVWAKPETPEDVMRAFTDSLNNHKEAHKIETDALKADITARDAAIEVLKGEKESALEQINNHDKVLRDKDAVIEQWNFMLEEEKKAVDDLKLKIVDNESAMDLLKHEKDNALAELIARDQIIENKDTEIKALNDNIGICCREVSARDKTINELQTTLQATHTATTKLETKLKRLTTDLTTHKTKHGDEFRARQALEAKSSSQLKDLRKNLKDTTTKLKSQESIIAEKEKLVRDMKKHNAESDTKVGVLEGKIRMMDEVMVKNGENYKRREERVKHLEMQIGFFGKAWELCRELDEKQKERGKVQGDGMAGLKEVDGKETGAVSSGENAGSKEGIADDGNVVSRDNDAGAVLSVD